MSIALPDKIKPANGQAFPLVDAQDVEMGDGKRLPDALPVPLTQEAYNAMLERGEVDDTTVYLIYRSEEGGDSG